ncbi:PIG-L family deacetylase [Luedemannella helvata]|uniref:PIG-L family deacetylase n=2 Tax=Luedemannella helvata TaxID=349315 RepID=A0ABN2JVD1_9ACTN
MVVAAHPDDAEFSFGATVARLTDEGTEVVYVVCTDGSLGGSNPRPSADDVSAVRYAEQRAAAAALGVHDVVFLGFRDGELTADVALRRAVTRQIRRWRPGIVLTHWPQRSLTFPIGASHPDHFAAGEAVLSAIYPDARNPRAYPDLLADGLEPHVVEEAWLPGLREPNHFVDVSRYADRKIEAILQHKSQFTEHSDPVASLGWVRDRMRHNGSYVGCDYAEAYVRIQTGSNAGAGPPPAPADSAAAHSLRW